MDRREFGVMFDLALYEVCDRQMSCHIRRPPLHNEDVTALYEVRREAAGHIFSSFRHRDHSRRRVRAETAVNERVRDAYGAAEHFPHLYDKTTGCQSFDWAQIMREEAEQKQQQEQQTRTQRAASSRGDTTKKGK